MWKALVLPFVFIAHLFGPKPTALQTVVREVTPSLVHITGVMYSPMEAKLAPYVCSGFVVGDGLVLTARHCVGGGLRVENLPAHVVRMSTDPIDLALVSVITAKPVLAPAAASPLENEPVIGMGFAYGREFAIAVAAHVLFVDSTPDPETMYPGLFVAGRYLPGMSGGPVINYEGHVVGMIQQSNTGIGYGVGVSTIRAFLAGASE